MELTQLRTLILVAELGSLSRAADRLCTAQPALSRHVRLLEEELGVQLFDRHGRGMVLTEHGRAVLDHATRIMHEVDDIKSSVVDERGTLSGQVSIGLTPTVSEMLALPLVTALRKAHPNASFRVVSAYSLYLLEWMHGGDLDIAILYDPKAIRSLKSEPFLEESFHIMGPADAGLDLRTPVPFADLAGRPLVLPGNTHSLRHIAENAAEEVGISLDVVIEADSFSVLKQLVLSGVGWTMLPLGAVVADIACSRLTAAPLIDPAPRRMLELSFPTDRPTSRLASAVRRALISTGADLVSRGVWPGKMLVHPGRAAQGADLDEDFD